MFLAQNKDPLDLSFDNTNYSTSLINKLETINQEGCGVVKWLHKIIHNNTEAFSKNVLIIDQTCIFKIYVSQKWNERESKI